MRWCTIERVDRYGVGGQDFTPRIFVSDSDFIAITQNGSLLNANGRLGPAEFEQVPDVPAIPPVY